jgi:hypothetical protein
MRFRTTHLRSVLLVPALMFAHGLMVRGLPERGRTVRGAGLLAQRLAHIRPLTHGTEYLP